MTNRLKIDAAQLKIEFSGNAEDIKRGYEMTRELLINHFQERLRQAEEEERERQRAEARASQRKPITRRMHASAPAPDKHWTPPPVDEPMHLSIAISSDFYNKICVLERSEFEESILGQVLDFDGINRLFIRSEQQDAFKNHFSIGKVLWRELTSNGRAKVRNEGGD